MPEDVPLTHPLVSKVIEQIQVKVEGFHFDSRKSLVEYDDVINKQRQIVYRLRDQVLLNQKHSSDKNQELVFKYLSNQINALININTSYENGKIDYDKAILEFMEILPMNSDTKSQLKKDLEKSSQPAEFLIKLLTDQWQARVKMFGSEIAGSILAFSVVSTLDNLWVEHLTTLDNLRDNVRLRGYAQKDPLVEYRKEGFEMFQKLMGHFEYNLARKLFRLEPVAPQEVTPQNVTEGRGGSMENKPVNNEPVNSEPVELPPLQQPIKKDKVVGRNDPCPCGSGKKYKKCCYPKFG
jgi:preprotein translocase subunit SecA